MPTKLDKTLKREIDVKGKPYIIAFSPEGLKITSKGKRNGQELTWDGLINGTGAAGGDSGGDSGTTVGLEESLDKVDEP
jgi:hypothetical protein